MEAALVAGEELDGEVHSEPILRHSVST
jgi:hypothetical protein